VIQSSSSVVYLLDAWIFSSSNAIDQQRSG